MLFSGETRVHISRADGRQRVWPRRGERYAEAALTVQHFGWNNI